MENFDKWLSSVDSEMLTTYAVEYGTAIVGAVLIFIFGRWLAKGVTRIVGRMLQKGNADPTIVSFLSNIVYALLLAVVIIAAVSALGVETTSLAAIIAAAGLAVGLALQGSLSNFAAGVMIIMFRPFKNGDYVEVAGIGGTVEQVNVFTTHLKTPDNREIIVPNSNIINDNITNYSVKATRRIDMVVGVSYEDNLGKVKQVLEDIISSDNRILGEPAPMIAVSELADSSVNLVVRPWVKREDYWDVKFDLTERIKTRFDAEGITIPFPQQQLHIVPDAEQLKAA